MPPKAMSYAAPSPAKTQKDFLVKDVIFQKPPLEPLQAQSLVPPAEEAVLKEPVLPASKNYADFVKIGVSSLKASLPLDTIPEI